MSRLHQMIDEQKERSDNDFAIRSDYLKQLTTLSAGSIVLIATLLSNVFKSALVHPLTIVIAIACFACSIVGGAVSYAVMLFNQDKLLPNNHWSKRVNKLLALIILVGFSGGMVCTGVFAILNIIHK